MSIPLKLRKQLKERSGGQCERIFDNGFRCAEYATDFHHWLPRGRGGPHSLDNAVHLGSLCHWFATNRPKEAAAEGLVLITRKQITPGGYPVARKEMLNAN